MVKPYKCSIKFFQKRLKELASVKLVSHSLLHWVSFYANVAELDPSMYGELSPSKPDKFSGVT